jgi:hypothetical protein
MYHTINHYYDSDNIPVIAFCNPQQTVCSYPASALVWVSCMMADTACVLCTLTLVHCSQVLLLYKISYYPQSVP